MTKLNDASQRYALCESPQSRLYIYDCDTLTYAMQNGGRIVFTDLTIAEAKCKMMNKLWRERKVRKNA